VESGEWRVESYPGSDTKDHEENRKGSLLQNSQSGRFYSPAKAMIAGDAPTAKTLVNGNTWI
jgi:hypothetical protein